MGILYYTGGSQTYTFSSGVKYLVELWGAESINCGNAGYAYAIVKPSSNVNLYFFVGGSPAESSNPYNGGYNGGGNGGSVGGTTSRGYGGGGATDLRTSTSSSSPQQYKILVAGGSGGGTSGGGHGGGVGENGIPYPRDEYDDGFKSQCGGTCATETSAGAGGLAPYLPRYEGTNDGTYYAGSGGGGGGGYYGGGGGSTNIVYGYGSARSFGAGNNGSNTGAGGTGGSYTSGVAGSYWSGDGGGGGGGSDFYRDSYANFIGGTTYMRAGIRPRKPVYTSNGVASVYPIYSQPEIRSIRMEGKYVYVEFGKTLDNNTEECFYYDYYYNREDGEVQIGVGSSVVIIGSESVTEKFLLETKKDGENSFKFSITNGIDTVNDIYRYKISNTAPNIYFNKNSMPSKLMQGDILNDLFTVETNLSGIDYRSETILIIDDVEYPYTFCQGVGQNSIQLPYLYDGKNKQTYRLKIKTRVCQTAQSAYGTGNDIWSNWIETEEMLVYAVAPQNNNLKFTTELKDRAIKRSTKVNLAWEEKRLTRLNDKGYRLMLYDGDNIVQTFDTPNTSIDVVLDYPHNKYYRFGVSILINGFLSEVVYSDKFFLTDIDPSSVSLSNDLTVSTSIEQTFDRIDVLINNETRILSRENINEKLPVYFFKNGNNDVNIKLYATETDFISHKYRVHIAYDEAELTPSKVLDIKSTVTINGQDNEPLKMSNKADQAIDLGIAEKEMSIVGIGGGVIEEITQKITVTKIDQGANSRMQLLEILGSVE